MLADLCNMYQFEMYQFDLLRILNPACTYVILLYRI